MQMGDPIIRLRDQAVGPAAHRFDCPSTCSKATLTEPVTVLVEGLHMHQKGLTMSNEHIRDGQVIRRSEVQYYDFAQQGAYSVQQPPFQILPGDSFSTKCEYLDSDTVFGSSSQEEMCMVFLSYYPRTTRPLFGFEAPFVCGYDLPIPDCSAAYEMMPLEGVSDLTRSFGTPSDTCNEDGSGTSDGDVGASSTSGVYHYSVSSLVVLVALAVTTIGVL